MQTITTKKFHFISNTEGWSGYTTNGCVAAYYPPNRPRPNRHDKTDLQGTFATIGGVLRLSSKPNVAGGGCAWELETTWQDLGVTEAPITKVSATYLYRFSVGHTQRSGNQGAQRKSLPTFDSSSMAIGSFRLFNSDDDLLGTFSDAIYAPACSAANDQGFEGTNSVKYPYLNGVGNQVADILPNWGIAVSTDVDIFVSNSLTDTVKFRLDGLLPDLTGQGYAKSRIYIDRILITITSGTVEEIETKTYPFILSSNLSDIEFTATSSHPEFDVENLYNYLSNSKWMSNSLTNGQSLKIIFPDGSKNCNTLILDNHNSISVMNSGTIKLQYSNYSDFRIRSVTDVATIAPTSEGVYKVSFDDISASYWRILWDGELNDYPYIGNLFLGSIFSIEKTCDWNYKSGDIEFSTINDMSINGTILSDQSFPGRYKSNLKFTLNNELFRQNFLAFINSVRGKKPFYFIDPLNGSINYVMLTNDYNPIQVEKYNLNSILDFSVKGIESYKPTNIISVDIYETEELITTVN